MKAKKRSRKLVKLLYKPRAEVIMDDEKYFCLDGDSMRGSGRYYTNDKAQCFSHELSNPDWIAQNVAILSGHVKAIFSPI